MAIADQTQASRGEQVAIPHFDQTTQADKGKQVATSNETSQAANGTKNQASVAATPSTDLTKAHQSLPSFTTGVHILDAFPAMVAAVKASPNWTAQPNPELYKDIKKAMRESIEKQLAAEGPAPRVETKSLRRHEEMIAAGWKARKMDFNKH